MDFHQPQLPTVSDQVPTPPPPENHPPQPPKRGKMLIFMIGVGVAIAGLLALGIIPRLNRQSELQAAVKGESTVPSVNVITPQRAPNNSSLLLPGSVVSLNQTTVYARSNGYLKRWLVDIGATVQKGQLLAEIESPDVDQQVAQAQAQVALAQANLVQNRAALDKGRSDLQQARVNLQLALQTWNRWKQLVRQGAVSQQDADTRYATYAANLATVQSAQNTIKSDEANVNAAVANVGSNQANLQRYIVLQSFNKVVAPFTGVIVARNIADGSLVTPGNGNAASGLFTIAAYNSLDVNVSVPQSLSQLLQLGQSAEVQVRELPQRVFAGKLIRTTNALDPSTRTLLSQVEVPNPEGVLRPGMYANVKFNINSPNPPFSVPDTALINNAQGMQLAIVTQDQKVHYQQVQLGRDNGTLVEVTSGLNGNESLITNPTVDLTEGTPVRAVAAKQK